MCVCRPAGEQRLLLTASGGYLRLMDSRITQIKAQDLLGPVTRLKNCERGRGAAGQEKWGVDCRMLRSLAAALPGVNRWKSEEVRVSIHASNPQTPKCV